MAEYFLELKKIDKRFGGVHALSEVDFSIKPGEVHCLAGENGSGKSTLIKVISGVYRPDSGDITIKGRKYGNLKPIDAISEGIQVIYQDLSLFPNLTVAENLAMNQEIEKGKKTVDWKNVMRIAEEAVSKINFEVDLKTELESLRIADKQLVAICRALLYDAKLIIMDEPTTSLTQKEVDSLFDIIEKVKKQGIAVLFVSHKLREVIQISQNITILRNGKKVSEGPISEYDEASISYHMTGHEYSDDRYSFRPAAESLPNIEITGLGKKGSFKEINLNIHPGEVVGITGLLGSGRTELAKALAGITKYETGKIRVNGKETVFNSINDAMKFGIGYVPEDRISEGLFMKQPVLWNMSVSSLGMLSGRTGILDKVKIKRIVNDAIKVLDVRPQKSSVEIGNLSGGNQQKVVLSRWLISGVKILILNGPTVGVDIGAKSEIHKKLHELAGKGMSIIMISDDLPELVQNCNRIIIMHRGVFQKDFNPGDITEDDVIEYLATLT